MARAGSDRGKTPRVSVSGCDHGVASVSSASGLLQAEDLRAAAPFNLEMDLTDAVALRRHNGDRRADQQDPEVTRSIEESVRPVLDQLANELSACLRYHSVTFRGQQLSQIVLGGGEASQPLADWLAARLDMACEPGSPLRSYENVTATGHTGQWDVAAGLALRETN